VYWSKCGNWPIMPHPCLVPRYRTSPTQSSAITCVSVVVPPVRVSLMYNNYLPRVICAISAASPLPHVRLMLASFLILVLVVLGSLCT